MIVLFFVGDVTVSAFQVLNADTTSKVYLLVAISMGLFFSKGSVCEYPIISPRKNSDLRVAPTDADSALCVFYAYVSCRLLWCLLIDSTKRRGTPCTLQLQAYPPASLVALFCSSAAYDVVSWVILVAKVYQACELDELRQC